MGEKAKQNLDQDDSYMSSLLDRFLPDWISGDGEAVRRGRLLVGSAFLLCATVSLDGALHSLRDGSLSGISAEHVVGTLAAAIFLLLVPLWLRLSRSLDITAALVILTVPAWIVWVGWQGDRVHGPVLLVLPLLPLIVTFLWNESVGIRVTLLLFVGLTSLHWMFGPGTVSLPALRLTTTLQVLAAMVLLGGGLAWLWERQRKRSERRIQRSTDLYRRLFEQSKDVVMVVSVEGEIRNINASGLELYGYDSLEEIARHNIESFYVDPEERREMLDQLEAEGWLKNYEVRHRTKDGRVIQVQGTVSVLRDHAGNITELVVILRDVTQERQAQENLLKMARFDPLTGLANRYTFQDQLEKSLARASRFRRRMALMMLDLDHFKEVNDTHGHDVGDALLVAVADRMLGCVRKVDTLARLGGDEIAVIKTDFDEPEHAAMLARRLLTAVSEPFEIQEVQIEISVSIGIAVFPPGDGDAQGLVKQADLALYRAKSDGRNTFRFYDQDIGNEVRSRMELAHDLATILENDHLYLEYQPQIDLVGERLTGIEALLRWRHPKHGIISPIHFISIAEDTGAMAEIGEWVLRRATEESKAWREALDLDVPLAVNIAGSQLRDPDFPQLVAAALDASGLAGESLELELTADQLRQLPRGSSRRLQDLGDLGVGLTLDDFGGSPVALEELRRLPIRKVKVDPGFVHRALEDEDAAAVVEGAVGLAGRIGLKPVAEGVENGRQAAFLKEIGCAEALGHWICRPMPAADLNIWLHEVVKGGKPWGDAGKGARE